MNEAKPACLRSFFHINRPSLFTSYMPEPSKPTVAEDVAAKAYLYELLDKSPAKSAQKACKSSDYTLFALGVLTLPVLVRTPLLRLHHRATHYAQRPAQRGTICLSYVVSDTEMARIGNVERAAVAEENQTHGDMIIVPGVPFGRLRHRNWTSLPPQGNQATTTRLSHNFPPAGAGCVFKILSWFQYASKTWPRTPFVGYGDDDTFWSLTRVQQTLSLLRPPEAFHRHIYAGAMQYHSWWDFSKMESHGWHFTFPAAAKMLQTSFDPVTAMPPNASAALQSLAARHFHWPYAMAHGLGVILSHGLARELPTSRAVAAFMELYDHCMCCTKAHSSIARMIPHQPPRCICYLR